MGLEGKNYFQFARYLGKVQYPETRSRPREDSATARGNGPGKLTV